MNTKDSKYNFLKKILKNQNIFFASVNLSAKPNLAVAEINKITDDGKIIISHNQMKKTVKNIIGNKQVSLIYTDQKNIWWRISGEASYDDCGPYYNYVKNLKTNEGYDVKGAIIIKIKNIKDLNKGKKII